MPLRSTAFSATPLTGCAASSLVFTFDIYRRASGVSVSFSRNTQETDPENPLLILGQLSQNRAGNEPEIRWFNPCFINTLITSIVALTFMLTDHSGHLLSNTQITIGEV